jgi:hypothetical protein
VTGRDHYVSQFHLRGFIDPASAGSRDPWLWVGDCKTGTVKRRSPKNFGWSRDLFGGPGGLADRSSTIESFLAREVEGPAAAALREFAAGERHGASGVPPELGRYLAWAAARSLPMKALYQSWIDTLPTGEWQYAEPPPTGFGDWHGIKHVHRMEHPNHGTRGDVPSEQVDSLRGQGWRLCLGRDDFLELVHLQAWYFQVRIFPRLKWVRVRTPADSYFIVCDRPVVWGFAGLTDVAPAELRNPNVQLIAPLARSLALFAHHQYSAPLEIIMPSDINRAVASAAHEWIAGPTEAVVREAFSERIYH